MAGKFVCPGVRTVALLLLTIATALCGCLLAGLAWAQPAPQEVPQAEAVHGPEGYEMLEERVRGPFVIGGELTINEPAEVELRFVLNYDPQTGEYLLLEVAEDRAQFFAIVDGGRAPIGLLGEVDWASVLEGEEENGSVTIPFTVRRAEWRLALIVGTEVVCRGYDFQQTGPGIGYQAVGGCEITDIYLQELGDMFFSDDFMWDSAGESTWENVQGQWRQQSLRVDAQAGSMQAPKSANAFSYFGKAQDGRALTVNGFWCWDEYSFQAAMRPAGMGACGLVFYYHDPQNYAAIRWTPKLSTAPDADSLSLIAVKDGHESVRRSVAGGYITQRWYQLRVNACAGLVQCYLDDVLMFSEQIDEFGQGLVGLLAEGAAGVFFDDTELAGFDLLADTFAQAVPGRWRVMRGRWRVANGAMRAATGQESIAAAGCPSWKRYAFGATVKAKGGSAGLVVGYQGVNQYYIFRWADKGSKQDYAGRAQIVIVTPEGPGVIADKPLAKPKAASRRAQVWLADGLITCSLDGQIAAEAVCGDVSGGTVGLYSQGAQAAFDDARVIMLPPKRVARVLKEFADAKTHWEMSEWASTKAPWVTPPEGSNVWWSKGDYWGDKCVRFELSDVGSKSGTVKTIIEGDPKTPASGFALLVTAAKGSKDLRVALMHGEEEVASATAEARSDPCPISFERKGRFIIATVDGQVTIEYES